MKKALFIPLLLAGLFISQPGSARVGDLLPKVHQLTRLKGMPFALHRQVVLQDSTACKYLQRVLEANGCTIVSEAKAKVTVNIVKEIPGAFNHEVTLFPDEAYRLQISADEVLIEAITPTGVIRAAQTLQQLAEGYAVGTEAFEALTLTDWPAFKVRGFMHDVGRSFIAYDEIKKQVDLLARFKVNVFHWHLTDYTGWRFEVKAYPQLTAAENNIRQPGCYYTQEQCRELVAYAAERGVMVIPEIDMPGHSHVFQKAMGYDMQTEQGVAALKKILDEAADVFQGVPYIHIGGDEVNITYPQFLETMSKYVRDKGLKVILWNRLVAGPPTASVCDLTQMWATSGKVVKGLPNIDCRYNYTNHFDVYADLVGIYKSNIYYERQGTPEVAGTISAAWNDTKTRTDADIVCQNNIYANILASTERAWYGGGEQYIEKGGTTLPNEGAEYDEFVDFERRFLFHKAHSLKNEPIAYVKQTNVRWRITDPFPNGGNHALALPPETSNADILPSGFEYQGKTYATRIATGAGIYLRHIWHPTVPSFFTSPANNQTAYAWTYVYSPIEQDAGAQIEFYTYSRSGNEKGPKTGAWDRRGSKIWLNGAEIAAPVWEQPDANIQQNHATQGLTNENLTAREVVKVHLRKGWNKVFLRLPHVNNGGTGRDKWQFTFVLTDPTGKQALDGIVYSPNKCIDDAADQLASRIDEISYYLDTHYSNNLGFYPESLALPLRKQLEQVRTTLQDSLTATEREAQRNELDAVFDKLKKEEEFTSLNMPKISEQAERHGYSFCTPLRGNRYPTAKGDNQPLVGEESFDKQTATWLFRLRKDGSYNIENASNGLYISPDSPNNQALRTVANTPAKGWTLKPSNELGYFIITSGTVQFNQTNNSGQGYHIFNWGGGTNTSDTGCKYQITHVFSEGGSTSVGSYPTINPNDLPSPVYYDLSGRRVYHPTRGFYILNGQKVLLK